MTQIAWTFTNTTTSNIFTTGVMSASVTKGRNSSNDQYGTGTLSFTIRNNTDQASAFSLNDKIKLETSGFEQSFWVNTISYDDKAGLGLGSTATIACGDLLALLGRVNVVSQALLETHTLGQIYAGLNSLLPSGSDFVVFGNGDSTAIGDTYSGSVLNRLNLNLETEQAVLALSSDDCNLYSRSNIYGFIPPTITFARESSGSYQFAYTDIKRVQLGVNFINECTVTPPVATAQTSTKTSSTAIYGVYGDSISTVDVTSAQALGLAQWITASRSNPTTISFVITFLDLPQNLYQFMVAIYDHLPAITLKYRVPSDVSDTITTQMVQGLRFDITPASTTFVMTTDPFSYYDYEIIYNTTDYDYDAEVKYDGGSWGSNIFEFNEPAFYNTAYKYSGGT